MNKSISQEMLFLLSWGGKTGLEKNDANKPADMGNVFVVRVSTYPDGSYISVDPLVRDFACGVDKFDNYLVVPQLLSLAS